MATSSILWLPNDPAELLAVTWDSQASDHEIDKAIALNGAGADWLDGKIETDTYLDHIAETVGDPYDFLDHVEDLLPKGLGLIYK